MICLPFQSLKVIEVQVHISYQNGEYMEIPTKSTTLMILRT